MVGSNSQKDAEKHFQEVSSMNIAYIFPGFPLFYMVWGSYLDSSVTIMVILASHPAISMILQLHISSCNSM